MDNILRSTNGQSATYYKKKGNIKIMPPKRLTNEEIERRIKERYPDESFELIEYYSLGTPMTVKCNGCGEYITVSKGTNFFIHTKKHGCKNCHGLWKEREKKLNDIKELYDIISTEVKESHTYYTVKCKNCGHIRCSTIPNLHRHLECGCKTGVYRNRSAEEFIQQVNENQSYGTYTLMSDYVNQTTKVLIKHNECGFIYYAWPHDLIADKAHCPKCRKKESKGSRYITKLLEEQGIFFEKEKTLNNSRQRFDFYIQKEDLEIAIEYNGEQHYIPNTHFDTPFEVQQERDEKKRKYCLDNNIELIEIPYYYSNEEIEKVILNLANRLNDYPEGEQE